MTTSRTREQWQRSNQQQHQEIARLRALLGREQHIALGYLGRAETAEAEVQRLRGLLHSEMICAMHYCETCEMAYQRPEGSTAVCPYCEVERLRDALDSIAGGHCCDEDHRETAWAALRPTAASPGGGKVEP